jgi:site-specific DNA-methyltransferase (adenine-specific)
MSGQYRVILAERNRIIQGDCLEVMRTLKRGLVDAIITDPPYCSGGRQQQGARTEISKSVDRSDDEWFLGDNMGTDTYLWFMRQVARECIRVARVGSPSYVFTDWRQYTTLVTAWESAGWTLRSVIVWDKAQAGAMGSWWRSNHEFVCAFSKGKPRQLSSHGYFNVWRGAKPQDGEHPTEKPVALMRWLASSIMPKRGLILDCFAGSGSTLVGAAMEGYDYLGIEANDDYVDIAKRRLASVQRPLLLESGRTYSTQPFPVQEYGEVAS